MNEIHNPAIISMNECAIFVTGLPGSGKSTLGRRLAAELGWPILDKDDFLEALFDSQGLGDEQWRRRLSIEADKQFEITALEQSNTVLVSHWRPSGRTDTGTPVDWVNRHFQNTVEVYCECDPELATRRFVSRTRHPGHLDTTKSEEPGTNSTVRQEAVSGRKGFGTSQTKLLHYSVLLSRKEHQYDVSFFLYYI